MNTWQRFRDYFLRINLANTPDIFERARIKMTFTLCFIAFVLLVFLDVTLIASALYFSLAVSIAIKMGIFACIYFIKYKSNHRLGAKIAVITIFSGLCLDIFFSETIALVDVLWYATLILFTFFTVGRRWAAIITVASTLVCLVYARYFFYGNFHDEEIYSPGQVGALLITVIFGFLLVFLFVHEAREAEGEAERKLKENILALSTLNEQLEKVNAELKISNKNLESFSYSVSHDLRAPLRTVIGYSGLLSKNYEDKLDEEGKVTVEAIVHGAKKMDVLINDLLDLSRSGSRELGVDEVDMNELMNEVVSDYEKSEGALMAQLTISPLPSVKGDRILLKQVLYNLFSNSIKYSSKKERPMIEIGSRREGDAYVFYFKDNGAGFDMKHAGKLFSIFQRLHGESEFKGTGVGLAIVKQVIERHGGRVWVESRPNEGATFYFSLPVK